MFHIQYTPEQFVPLISTSKELRPAESSETAVVELQGWYLVYCVLKALEIDALQIAPETSWTGAVEECLNFLGRVKHIEYSENLLRRTNREITFIVNGQKVSQDLTYPIPV